jgi:hypothetical protein
MTKTRDLTGERFGKLIAIEKLFEKSPNGTTLWKCKCDCGNIHKANYSNLVAGHVKSCGCVRKSIMASVKNIYEDMGDYYIGITSSGVEFKIDKEDFEKVKRFSWCIGGTGYVIARRGKYENIRIHRMILDLTDNRTIDHINLDKMDNRKVNLRICNASQNEMNKRAGSNNTSGCRGVSYIKKFDRWRASITAYGKRVYLGQFKNIEDAIRVRKEAEPKYFKEFACKI